MATSNHVFGDQVIPVVVINHVLVISIKLVSSAISYIYHSIPEPVSVLAIHSKPTKKISSPLSGYVITGVVGGVVSVHLVVSVNIPVHRPIITFHVIVCRYPELLCAIALT